MTKTEKYFFLTYSFCSFLFLISTTNYLSLDDIINKAGQMDVSVICSLQQIAQN